MYSRKLIGAIVGLAVYGMLGTANAAVIFEQPISAGESTGGVSDGDSFQRFDSFILDQDATLTDVHWFGRVPSDSSLDFTISLYESAGSFPDLASIFYSVDVSAVLMDLGFGEIFDEFWVDPIPSVDLIGGTDYWISIVGSDFSWSTSSLQGTSLALRLSDDAFLLQGSNLAFSLTSTPIPEPSSAVLFAVGSLVVGAALRRKAN